MVQTIQDGMVTTGSIIDALGGTSKVAAALSLSRAAVSCWKSRPGGIPAPHWASLVRLAGENGVEVTLETLADLATREPAEARP